MTVRFSQPPSVATPRAPSAEEVAKTIGLHKRRLLPKWAISLGAVALVGLVVGGAAWSFRSKGPGPRYETAEVTRGRLEVTVSTTGTLAAVGVVEVGSEVSGKIQRVLVANNARVTKGQVLAEIDPMQLKSEVTQSDAQAAASQASIAQAQATAVEAHLALERAEEQAKLGLIAKKDLETARAANARAKAAVASAQANSQLSSAAAKTARWKLTRTSIIAPIDGIVLARLIEPGQIVQANFQTPVLFRIASDLSQLELDVDIDEADIGKVREGQSATFQVDAYPDKSFPSTVQSIYNEAKTSQGVVTYKAVLSVKNDELLLRPGMTASATVVTQAQDNQLLVPSAALRFQPPGMSGSSGPSGPPGAARAAASAPTLRDPRDKFVWVLAPSGELKPVEVHPESTDGQKTAVTGELQPGMRLALDVLEEP